MLSTVPTCATYDPAYAYELAVIIQDGIRRMYQEMEDRFYYLTVYNENYVQPPMPEGEGVREGILRGLYKYKPAANGPAVAQLFGSGPILNEALKAQQILAERYQVATDVWSVTSYNELRRDGSGDGALEPAASGRAARACRTSSTALEGSNGPIIASSRLHEDRAGSARAVAAGRGCIRSAPTASGAARIASICGSSSRFRRRRSCRLRCRRWLAKARSTREWRRRRWAEMGFDPERKDPAKT